MSEVKRICENCQYCMLGNGGLVCAGNDEYYGKFVDDDFTCPNWKISFSVYQDLYFPIN